MPWWGWIALGGLLLIAELLAGGALYLIFIGVAAILVGILAAVFGDIPPWAHWVIFAVLALLLLVGLRRHARTRLNRNDGFESIVGELAVAIEAIAPLDFGRVELHGAKWEARNIGSTALAPGQRARVEQVDGLTLHLRAEEQ